MFYFINHQGLPDYDEPVYRPPSEADSLIFQVTLGCSHNKCAFCYMYREKRFRARKEEEVIAEIEKAAEHLPRVSRIFFADGDAMALSVERLKKLASACYSRFQSLERITAYATPQNLLHKKPEELEQIRESGVTLLYLGVESGDDEVLKRIDKGATADEIVLAAEKAHTAGFDLSVTVILGIAGKEDSEKHAENTGKIISRMSPKYASALTLMLGPFEDDYREAYGNAWKPLNRLESLDEVRRILEATDVQREVIFRSNHASNWLALKGTLPQDKKRLIKIITETLNDPDSPHWRSPWMRGL